MSMIENILADAGFDDRVKIIKVRYALEVIKNEVIKLGLLIIVFSLLHSFWEFLFALAILSPLRVLSGGMHMKTNVGCFFYSLGFYILSVKLLPLLYVPESAFFVMLIFASLSIAILSPVPSHKRPIKTSARRTALKRWTLIFLGIDIVILFSLWYKAWQVLFIIGVWLVALQATQLIVTYIFRKRKGVQNV